MEELTQLMANLLNYLIVPTKLTPKELKNLEAERKEEGVKTRSKKQGVMDQYKKFKCTGKIDGANFDLIGIFDAGKLMKLRFQVADVLLNEIE